MHIKSLFQITFVYHIRQYLWLLGNFYAPLATSSASAICEQVLKSFQSCADVDGAEGVAAPHGIRLQA